MTYFLRSGNTYRVTDEAALDLHQLLPAGNYIIKEDQNGNLYLEETDRFKALPKYYGDTLRNVSRIHNTFMDRTASTGVMLTGEKGSGKTLLAKELSIFGYLSGMPTIVINQPWIGDRFNKFICDIDQPCIILFDEFEKVYDAHKQESVLTLLDGVFPSKKLFVLTCNDKWRIDSHMRNRPGRIFYMLDFKGLAADFIAEYCEDTLKNKSWIEQIVKIATLFNEFNFDMLKALVEDMNRYDESPQEAMKMLNAKPEYDKGGNDLVYDIELVRNGVKVSKDRLYPREWRNNPLTAQFIAIEISGSDDEEEVIAENGNSASGKLRPVGRDVDSEDESTITFGQADLKNVDGVTGTFVYADAEGNAMKLTKRPVKTYNYWDAL